jgi:uncharacterized protein YjbJ (UPF0337 family)
VKGRIKGEIGKVTTTQTSEVSGKAEKKAANVQKSIGPARKKAVKG